MTDKLPPNLLALFAPRPPLPYSKPLDRDPAKRAGPLITGVGQYLQLLKDYDPDYVPTETVEEKKKRKVKRPLIVSQSLYVAYMVLTQD
jgi:U1 small nuclear ribonucleoprotein 70kDa